MTDTWLPFCVPELGPPAKRGYGGVPTRSLAEIEGEVKHSMEGYVAGAIGRLMTPLTSDPYTQASWHISVPKIGKPRQHFALEAICWHAGLPGDRRFDTSLVGNLTLVGIEHEDYPDNKLNANQLHWTVEISRAIRALCPRVAPRPPALRVNLWEHRMLSATSCPSGLIPWAPIIAALKEDDMGMTPQQETEFAALKKQVAALVGEDLTDDALEARLVARDTYLANAGIVITKAMTLIQAGSSRVIVLNDIKAACDRVIADIGAGKY
ncbi:MAG: hypothetical protein A2V88_12300 [Elusimicrobia bacterium RBG_16_66_12]|nr:MAG: hypothetical protein A2V88_12300 [Elusimicrobia bacterium RBG_16_66_12]